MTPEGIEIDIARQVKKGKTRPDAIRYLIMRAEREIRDSERLIEIIKYEAEDELSEGDKERIAAEEQVIHFDRTRIVLLNEAATR